MKSATSKVLWWQWGKADERMNFSVLHFPSIKKRMENRMVFGLGNA